jgi:hypothetical protein
MIRQGRLFLVIGEAKSLKTSSKKTVRLEG